MSEYILHAWAVNFVNKLVKNARHITAITSPSKPNIYPSASEASSLALVMQKSKIILAFLTTCL